jgi:hypothetical protein
LPASQPVNNILLITVLHPYYKFDYIQLTWGGAEEQENERRNGNRNAINWQDEASKIVEATVSLRCIRKNIIFNYNIVTQMEKYYSRRLPATAAPENEGPAATKTLLSEYDRYRQTLIDKDEDEGWASELRRYKNYHPNDVTKDTDIVQWWQVSSFFFLQGPFLI